MIEKINKLTLPATIIIASVILGGFFYASQVNKQRSIERQQQIKIEQQKQEQLVEEQKEQIEQAERCREDGTKAYDYYKKNNPLTTGYFLNPEFHFNKKLQLCLYSGGYSSGSYWERFVKNAYTEEWIIYLDKNQSVAGKGLYDDFWEEYEKLFTE